MTILHDNKSNVKKVKDLILSLDQGTSSSRAVLFDKEQKIVAIEQKEYKQYYPKAGRVEQKPEEIWTSQLNCAVNILNKNNIKSEEIAGIGITNQRETIIVWDKKTGEPVYNAIVWQDTRTGDMCNEISNNKISKYIKKNTGLTIDAYFSATKIRWILENVKNARKKALNEELLCGTVDTWLVWKLTGGKHHVTDFSNASRTMLFNIRTLKWDKKILKYFGIPETMLPKVVNSSEIIGEVSPDFSSLSGIKISGIAGDQQAALFGQNCFRKADVTATYGTGCFMLMNTGKKLSISENGLLSTIAWGIDNKITYALEGSVFEAGSVVNWLQNELKIIEKPEDTDKICRKIKSTKGVYFVPAFSGLGTPYWKPKTRGTIFGITQKTSSEHIVRAAMEAIAFSVKDVISAMQNDSGAKLKSLKVAGGVSANNFLMQFQSDILQKKVIRYENIETTALGVALLAGLSVNFWTWEEINKQKQTDKEFYSEIEKKTSKKLYKKRNKVLKKIIKLYS